MPCQGDYPPGYDAGYRVGQSDRASLCARNNVLARLLCQACTVLDLRSEMQRHNLTELEAWFRKHKAFDSKEGRK